jgi:hypothetical protein
MTEADSEITYDDFVRARKLYWKQEAKKLGSEVELPEFDKVELGAEDSNFLLYSAGPGGLFAVFEDAAETGWFYLYKASDGRIVKCTHVYNRATVAVDEEVIDIGWAADNSACGIAVWGQFRAFLGVSSDLHLRKPLRSADEDGIYASEWPAGFDHYLEKKVE